MDAPLEKDIDRLGRASRKAAGITVSGVIVVFLAMVYAAWQLQSLQKDVVRSQERLRTLKQEAEEATAQVTVLQTEIDRAKEEKQRYQKQISALNSEISELQQKLGETTDLSRSEHPVDMEDLKGIAIQNPAQAKVLTDILKFRLRHIGWKLGGEGQKKDSIRRALRCMCFPQII